MINKTKIFLDNFTSLMQRIVITSDIPVSNIDLTTHMRTKLSGTNIDMAIDFPGKEKFWQIFISSKSFRGPLKL